MIVFTETQGRLELTYEAEFGPGEWVERELERSGEVRIARTFYFSKEDLVRKADETEGRTEFEELEETNDSFTFALGTLESGYFKIAGDKLGIERDVYLAADLPLSDRTFIAHRNISIFRQIARVTAEDIYIGGDKANAMPISDFEKLLKSFPNSTELDRYANAKVARIVGDYFETTTSAEKKFEDYLNKRGRETPIHDIPDVYQFEVSKYEFIRNKIVELLRDESSFSENEWRDLMLQFILLIFPKYVCVLRNLLVKDFYTSSKKSKNRYVDIALIDANGHIDIIEIKKPFENCLVSESDYRGNFTPRKELSGTIMQAEKYLFHLSKWGVAGETDINSRQASHLPAGLKVKITNPQAIVIAGRSNALSTQQLFDFELIKRKYANIIDILSYDDLLNRLSSIIEKFKRDV
jgi:hypothetical protein